jgi:hypothetical protein
MSFILNLGEIVLMVLLSIDTLGFVAQNRKNPEGVNQKDYFRLCFSWIFFLVLRQLFACACFGFLSNLIQLVAFAAKAFVTIPMLNGAETVYTKLVEENIARAYVEKAINMVKEKIGAKTQ